MAERATQQSHSRHRPAPLPPVAPLPTDAAFVVQFRRQGAGQGIWYAGRIEHLVSGRAAHFQSRAQLLAFMAKVLGEGAGK